MQLRVSKSDLLGELNFVRAAFIKADPKAAHSHTVRLEAKEHYLHLTAVGTLMRLDSKIRCNVDSDGYADVHGPTLTTYISMLSSGPVSIEESNGHLSVSQGADAVLRLRPQVNMWTPPEPISDGVHVIVKGSALEELLASVIYAVMPEETRYIKPAALFQFESQRLRLVGTDGRRMAVADVPVESSLAARILVPQFALTTIKQLASDKTDVTLDADQRRVQFSNSRRSISTGLVDTQFPPYERFIAPNGQDTQTTVDTEALLQAIKAVTVLNESDLSSVVVIVAKDSMLVEADNTDGKNAARQSLTAVTPKLGTPKFHCNAKLLQQALQSFPADDVTLHFGAGQQPILLIPASVNDVSRLSVVMPLSGKKK